jgi:exonuclease III
VTVVCLQETKIAHWTTRLVAETLGQDFAKNFTALPANDTRGGMLLAATCSHFKLHNACTTAYTVSTTITMKADNVSWTITGVYGPQTDQDKLAFLDELESMKVNCLERWLIVGDFNLIYKAEDKNNNRLNRRLMNRFKQVIDANQLMELYLRGGKFTWSNEQDTPTFTRIDHFFGTPKWHALFPNIDLQALPTMGSDHCPLFLTGDARQHYIGFRFESFWVNMAGVLEVIQEVWNQPVNTQDAIVRMHVKLIRTAKALKIWKRQNLGSLPLLLAIAKEELLLLDTTQEQRQLTPEELDFRRYLKAKADGLAAIQRTRARQHSRLTWIRKGDACTKLFMLHANNRKRKLHIPILHTNLGPTNRHQQEEEAVYDHFTSLLGEVQQRTLSLNWSHLGYQTHDLSDLEESFEEDEIKKVIKQLPTENHQD